MSYIFGGTRPDAGPDAAPAPDPVDAADCDEDCWWRGVCVWCHGGLCELHGDTFDCVHQDDIAHSACHRGGCAPCAEQDEAERRGDEIRAGDTDPWPGELEPDTS